MKNNKLTKIISIVLIQTFLLSNIAWAGAGDFISNLHKYHLKPLAFREVLNESKKNNPLIQKLQNRNYMLNLRQNLKDALMGGVILDKNIETFKSEIVDILIRETNDKDRIKMVEVLIDKAVNEMGDVWNSDALDILIQADSNEYMSMGVFNQYELSSKLYLKGLSVEEKIILYEIDRELKTLELYPEREETIRREIADLYTELADIYDNGIDEQKYQGYLLLSQMQDIYADVFKIKKSNQFSVADNTYLEQEWDEIFKTYKRLLVDYCYEITKYKYKNRYIAYETILENIGYSFSDIIERISGYDFELAMDNADILLKWMLKFYRQINNKDGEAKIIKKIDGIIFDITKPINSALDTKNIISSENNEEFLFGFDPMTILMFLSVTAKFIAPYIIKFSKWVLSLSAIILIARFIPADAHNIGVFNLFSPIFKQPYAGFALMGLGVQLIKNKDAKKRNDEDKKQAEYRKRFADTISWDEFKTGLMQKARSENSLIPKPAVVDIDTQFVTLGQRKSNEKDKRIRMYTGNLLGKRILFENVVINGKVCLKLWEIKEDSIGRKRYDYIRTYYYSDEGKEELIDSIKSIPIDNDGIAIHPLTPGILLCFPKLPDNSKKIKMDSAVVIFDETDNIINVYRSSSKPDKFLHFLYKDEKLDDITAIFVGGNLNQTCFEKYKFSGVFKNEELSTIINPTTKYFYIKIGKNKYPVTKTNKVPELLWIEDNKPVKSQCNGNIEVPFVWRNTEGKVLNISFFRIKESDIIGFQGSIENIITDNNGYVSLGSYLDSVKLVNGHTMVSVVIDRDVNGYPVILRVDDWGLGNYVNNVYRIKKNNKGIIKSIDLKAGLNPLDSTDRKVVRNQESVPEKSFKTNMHNLRDKITEGKIVTGLVTSIIGYLGINGFSQIRLGYNFGKVKCIGKIDYNKEKITIYTLKKEFSNNKFTIIPDLDNKSDYLKYIEFEKSFDFDGRFIEGSEVWVRDEVERIKKEILNKIDKLNDYRQSNKDKVQYAVNEITNMIVRIKETLTEKDKESIRNLIFTFSIKNGFVYKEVISKWVSDIMLMLILDVEAIKNDEEDVTKQKINPIKSIPDYNLIKQKTAWDIKNKSYISFKRLMKDVNNRLSKELSFYKDDSYAVVLDKLEKHIILLEAIKWDLQCNKDRIKNKDKLKLIEDITQQMVKVKNKIKYNIKNIEEKIDTQLFNRLNLLFYDGKYNYFNCNKLMPVKDIKTSQWTVNSSA